MISWNIGRAGCALVVILVCTPFGAGADPDQLIRVTPLELDFGEVDIGATSSQQVHVKNDNGHWLLVKAIYLKPGGSEDFSIATDLEVPVMLTSGNEVVVTVSFSPSSAGERAAVLMVDSDDPEWPYIEVPISGVGKSAGVLTIEDILAFFDAGVEAGTIAGSGPGQSGRAHLRVFKFKLLLAAFFLDQGWQQAACNLLWSLYQLSDGQRPPRDWIEGDGVPELNAMLLQLLSDLGCR